MTSHSVPLVGAHFRPPAKAILQVLFSGCPLRIVPEPDNPYDANALAVLVATKDIPAGAHEDLASIAAPFGFSLDDILAESEWHLGYIKATEAIWLQPRVLSWLMEHINDPADTVPGRLSFDPSGKPLVVVEL